MGVRKLIASWPVAKQFSSDDPLALGGAAKSAQTEALTPRTETADRVVGSVCPYCAVGCGQLVYVKDDKVTQIEGDPASPVSRGRLCPKGSASEQLVNNPSRELKVKYRRPHGTRWEELSLDRAMDMIADRDIATRTATLEEDDEKMEFTLKHTIAMADLHVPIRAGTDIAFLGGIVNHILEHGREFRDYVVRYTNASVVIDERFQDTEDLDGLFSAGTTTGRRTTSRAGSTRA